MAQFNPEKVFRYPLDPPLWVYRWNSNILLCYDKEPVDGDGVLNYRHALDYSLIRDRRHALGAWLKEMKPDDEESLPSQALIDIVEPLPFDDDGSVEHDQLLERIDMAASVMGAGGACTSCGQPVIEEGDEKGNIDHFRGCEVMSYLLWRAIHREDEEPTLADVIRAANEQIERMQ